MCLTEETGLLDQPHSGTSCSVGHEFSVAESTILLKYGVFKQQYITLCIDRLITVSDQRLTGTQSCVFLRSL